MTNQPKYKKHIFICINERSPDNPKGDCARCGGNEIRLKFIQLINQHGLKGIVRANKSGCLDACEMGAALVIYPDNIWYTHVSLNDVEEIFNTTIISDRVVERLAASEKTWVQLKEIRG
ncbi:MAG: ferredoxin [Fidelibacterota bacterium]